MTNEFDPKKTPPVGYIVYIDDNGNMIVLNEIDLAPYFPPDASADGVHGQPKPVERHPELRGHRNVLDV